MVESIKRQGFIPAVVLMKQNNMDKRSTPGQRQGVSNLTEIEELFVIQSQSI